MVRFVNPDWYVESIDVWIRAFILIGMWIRSKRGTGTRDVARGCNRVSDVAWDAAAFRTEYGGTRYEIGPGALGVFI